MKAFHFGDVIVSPVFTQTPASRLNANGKLETVLLTHCILLNPQGRVLGVGTAVKASEDPIDDSKASKLALGRALGETHLSREERCTVMRTLIGYIASLPRAEE